MKLSVYIPKALEDELRREADDRNLTPSRIVQELVEERFQRTRRRFSPGFLALVGSWEDDRTADEIIRDIEEHRSSSDERPELR